MSSLLLVRHGQASFLSDNYDRLSELGRRQARRVGESLHSVGAIDRMVAGPLQRQTRTAELAHEAARARVAVEIVSELEEHRALELIENHLPALAAQHEDVARALERLNQADESSRPRAFEHVFEKVMHHWCDDAAFPELVESYSAFEARVTGCIDELTSRSGVTMAFTSAGVIGVAVGHVLGVERKQRLSLGFAVQNASFTEILFNSRKDRRRVTLSRFNCVGHLPVAEWTYR